MNHDSSLGMPASDSLAHAHARRPSLHIVPHGARGILQHYIRDIVYGANDGLITTFAVVAGVAGGALSGRAVLIVGAANLIADGLSMGVGNYLGIRADEGARLVQGLPEAEASPVKHGLMTFLAFVIAGAVPLVPYLTSSPPQFLLETASLLTFGTLFGVGAARSIFSVEPWWRTGLEMLALGVAVACAAYIAGATGAWLATSSL